MSAATQRNLTGETSGTIVIGDLFRSNPRAWAASCRKCHSEFALDHKGAMIRLNAGLDIICPNVGCTSGRDALAEYDKQAYRKARQKERDAEEAAFERAMRMKYGNQETR